MESYKRGSHTVWDCKYHIVWVTKYRFAILGGDVGQRCRELIRETARAHEMVIHAGSINRDHVHMLLSVPPSLSASRAVQYLKGRSSHKLLAEFASLRKRYWGQHLWARGYWVASSGNVTDEVWAEYIFAKSTSIKGRGCKFGGRAAKAIELTWGDLRHCSTV